MTKFIIILIWITCLLVWIGLFQAFGILGFAIMLGLYFYIMDLRKKGKIWNKD